VYYRREICILSMKSCAEPCAIPGRSRGRDHWVGNHSLTIGPDAAIKAHLNAHAIIIISGAVVGNVTANERLEIRESGSVDGDMASASLIVLEGAVLRGRIDTGVNRAAPEGRPTSRGV
jgi:cytoskeletal protein CcmA (bactofilin family)